VAEGNDGTFTVFVSPASHPTITVHYSMSGTAMQGTDYTLSGTPGQITIPANQPTGSVTLHAIADHVTEGSETATMTLTSGSGYTVSPANSATIIIIDGR
jgi:hypothetical protein